MDSAKAGEQEDQRVGEVEQPAATQALSTQGKPGARPCQSHDR